MSHHTAEAWLKDNPGLGGLSLPGAGKLEEKPQPKSKPTETGQSTATWLEDPKGIYFKDSAISFFNKQDRDYYQKELALQTSRAGRKRPGEEGFIGPSTGPDNIKFDLPDDPTDPKRYVPTSAELEALHTAGLLIDPNTQMPLYPLTNASSEFKRKISGQIQNPLLAAGAMAGEVVVGAAEEFGKQVRFGLEHTFTKEGRQYGDRKREEYVNAVALKEAELGRSLDFYERRILFDETFDVPGIDTPLGKLSFRTPVELAAEMALPGTILDKAFGLGFKGLYRGFKTVGGEAYYGLRKTNVAGAVQDQAQIVPPPEKNPFNLPEVKVELTKSESLYSSLKEMVGMEVTIYDDLMDQIGDIIVDTKSVAESLGNAMSADLDFRIRRDFFLNDKGQVPGVPKVDGAQPTISDIAADYERYKPHLNERQRQVMEEIRDRLAPLRESLDQFNVRIGQRLDIQEGGFYIPRGQAFTVRQITGEVAATGKRQSFKQKASEPSQGAGIEDNLTYVPFADTIKSYVKAVGDEAANQYITKVLNNAKMPDGTPLSSTAKARLMNNPVYVKVQNLLKEQKKKRKKLVATTVKNKILQRVARAANRTAEKNAERHQNEIRRVEQYTGSTEQRAVGARVERSKNRYEDFSGAYNVADIKLARKIGRDAKNDSRKMIKKIQSTIEELRSIDSKYKNVDNKLYKKTLKLQELLDEYDQLAQSANESVKKLDVPKEVKETVEEVTQEVSEEAQKEIDETLRQVSQLQKEATGAIEVEGGGVRYESRPGDPPDPLRMREYIVNERNLLVPIMGKIIRKIALTSEEFEMFEQYKSAVEIFARTQPNNPNVQVRQKQLELVGEPTLQDPVGFEDEFGDVVLAADAEAAARQAEFLDSAGEQYENLLNKIDEINEGTDELFDAIGPLAEKLDNLKFAKGLYEGLDAMFQKQERAQRNAVEQQIRMTAEKRRLKNEHTLVTREQARLDKLLSNVKEKDIKRIQKQIEIEHGQAAKVSDNAIKALFNMHSAKVAKRAIDEEYNELADEYSRVLSEESKTPEGYLRGSESRIKQMTGTDYPAELIRQINKIMEQQGGVKGPGTGILKAIQWHSGLYRSLRATLDDSAPTIHGLLQLFNNPTLAGKAFVWHWRAWGNGGEELLGNYISKFNKEAKAKNLLTTDEWSALGLRIGGADTEFTIGKQAFTRKLQKVRGIKQANMAFGYYGDRLRMDWANDLLEQYMKEGRTLDEIMNSDLGKQIVDGVNTATGYANKRFGAELGEILTFAPRFFQARLNNIARTAKGTIKDPLGALVDAVPGAEAVGRQILQTDKVALPRFATATPQERIARRAMLRLISQGTLLTVGINTALGNETDFDILKKDSKGDWVYNSNFMRIRFADRDWSIFGTYDSIIRLLIMSGVALTDDNLGNEFQGLRGIASGPVSLAWDLLSGETFEQTEPKAGWSATDTGFMPVDGLTPYIGYLIESHLPFAFDQIPDVAEQVNQGDVKGALAMAAGEFMGAKSSPLGYRDLLQEISKEKVAAGIPSPTRSVDGIGWDPENLSKAEERIIKEDPRMKDILEQFDVRNPTELGTAFENLEINFTNLENNLIEAMRKDASGKELANQISELKSRRAETYELFVDNNKELLDEIKTEEGDLNRADYWAQLYYNTELETYPENGFMDFEKFETEREKIISDAIAENPLYGKYITGSGPNTFRGTRYKNEEVRSLIEEYDNDIQEMKQYWDISLRTAKHFGYEEEYREYLLSKNPVEYKKSGKHKDIIKALEKEIRKQKDHLRLTNPRLEALLYKWGSITTPINPTVMRMREALVADAEGGDVNTMDIQRLINQALR
tara:strand:- start:46 stop:5529 length:5484 start_codon:yes stop_codon:yes gene_type:complete